MRIHRRSVTGKTAIAAVGVSLLAAFAPIAVGVSSAAASAPPWEADGNAAPPYGNIVFYDASGNQVTSGSDLAHLFDYAVATTGRDSNAIKATLSFKSPQNGVLPANWSGSQEGTTTTDTGVNGQLGSAPADIQSAAATNPVVASGPDDADASTFVQSFPSDTTAGYADTIQVRIQDSGPNNAGNLGSSTYWETDIGYNSGSTAITVDGQSIAPGTWLELFPFVTTTTTTLAVSPASPQPVTTQVTLTASITPSTIPGTVQFFDNGTAVGSPADVSNGQATYMEAPAQGAHAFTATFSPNIGDETGANSTSAAIYTQSGSGTQNYTITAPPQSTTTTLASSANPSVVGQIVTYTATVTPSSSSAPDGGTVSFTDGPTTVCGDVPLSTTTGEATCQQTYASATGASPHSINASYGGDEAFLASSTSSALSQAVNPSSNSTLATASPSPGITGQPVTYTATVTTMAPGSGTPTGTVSFADNDQPIAGCSAQPVSGAGKATCQLTYSSVGDHSIVATFSSNSGNYNGSTSSAINENVIAPTAPGAPTGLSATPGNGQALLTWTAPAFNGHSPITGYDVFVGTVSGGESAAPVNSKPVTARTYTVTGLANKTKYFFTVEAVNAVGPSAPSSEATAIPALAAGYWLVGGDGGVFGFGGAGFFGSLGATHLNAPIVGMAHTPDRGGYWLVGRDGGVFAFGHAGYHGSLGDLRLNAPIVSIVATPSGHGYWLVASDGGVFAFGDAGYYGSLGAIHLNKPIVGMITTKTGRGYLLVAADGGVFAFGDAVYDGSLGGIKLNEPIVGVVPAPDGLGYTLVAADGGVFAFGHGSYFGSLGDLRLSQPIRAIVATPDDGGYWLIGRDGGIFAFGDAHYDGSLPALGVNVSDIVGGA